MPKTYNIVAAGDKKDSHDLTGLQIEETDEGYELVVPRRVLAKAAYSSHPGGPLFQFKFDDFHRWNWTLSVLQASESEMSGVWGNTNREEGPSQEGDSWTATGTTTGDPGEDEARAASAK